MTTPAVPRKSNRKRTVIMMLVGIVVMVAVFAFLFPQMGNYAEAFTRLASVPPIWIGALIASALINILVYPFTAIAAIPHLRYRYAFINRQAGFTISNVIPGGGAIAVGTQYSILSRYGVSAPSAAAAVSADAIWTYLMVLGTPALAVVMLVIEGRSAAGMTTVAVLGLVAVIVSVIAIVAVLRSPENAGRVGRWLQRPVDWIWHLLKKTPPDAEDRIVDFNLHASTMVGERWQMLTITNIGAQLGPYLVLVCAIAGLGALHHPITLVEAFAAYSIALLLTSFPITPGGLGTVDAALVLLLTQFGMQSSDAIAADLIWRLVWFLPQVLVGGVSLGIFTWDNRKGRQPK